MRTVEDHIEGLIPYVPGKPIEEVKRELGLTEVVKLASNENPLGASPKAVEAMRRYAGEMNLYPDGSAHFLKSAIAERMGVAPGELVVTNGSNEAIELIIRTFAYPGCKTVTSKAAFIVYRLASQAMGVGVEEVDLTEGYGFDLEGIAARLDDRTRFVFLANPNNPTGTWFDEASLRAFLRRVSADTIVVLDEAYAEYVAEADYPSGIALRSEFPNLVVTRTFSKAYGLAGLRVGYAVMPEWMCDYVNRVRAPFNSGRLGQLAALAALDDDDFLEASVAHNNRGLARLSRAVEALPVEVVPSAANFALLGLPCASQEVFSTMLGEGVIVRPMAGYGLPNHIRVTIGLDHEMDRFVGALRKVVKATT